MFRNRKDAGKKLAETLKIYQNSEAVVIALPRGGVVVGYEVSKVLNIPFDVLVVRKIGSPFNPEYSIGAISEKNTLVMARNRNVKYKTEEIKKIIDQETEELKRRIKVYRRRPLPDIKNKTVIVVDDGLATGLTAKAAIFTLKKLKAKEIIFAAPVCAQDSISTILPEVNKINCLLTPDNFTSVGSYYEDFSQVSDREVTALLRKYRNRKKH